MLQYMFRSNFGKNPEKRLLNSSCYIEIGQKQKEENHYVSRNDVKVINFDVAYVITHLILLTYGLKLCAHVHR